jgi:transposase
MEIAGSPRNAFRDSLMWILAEVEHWMDAGESNPTNSNQTPNAARQCMGVRLRATRFVVERETARIRSQGP